VCDLLQSIFITASLYTALPFPRYLITDIVLLLLYRSLPYCSVRSCRAASVVLNLDGSNSYAAISRYLNKE